MSLLTEVTSSFLEAEVGRIGTLRGSVKVASGSTTIATTLVSGATQLVTLDSKIPAGAVITDVIVRVITVATGGSLSLGAVSVADLMAAADVDGAPWSTVGYKKAAAVAAAPVLSTGVSSLQLVASASTVTGGSFAFQVLYIV